MPSSILSSTTLLITLAKSEFESDIVCPWHTKHLRFFKILLFKLSAAKLFVVRKINKNSPIIVFFIF